MTKEDAIAKLDRMKRSFLFDDYEHIEALDLAIEALRGDWVGKDWLPTPENINALPKPLRDYVCDLETRCDPAGDIARLALVEDQNVMLTKLVEDLQNSWRMCNKERLDLRYQLTAAEEALKAMERERNQWKTFALADAEVRGHYWHDQFCEKEQESAETKREIEHLKANGTVSALGMCPNCEELKAKLQVHQDKVDQLKKFALSDYCHGYPAFFETVINLWPDPTSERKTLDEKEKLKALIQYINDGREFGLLLPNQREILELVYKKYCDLWGIPDPASEPKTVDEKIEIACNKYPDLRELFEE